MKMHIREHLDYPATKQELVQACNMMSDVPPADREWFNEHLPEGTYNSPEDVIVKLGL